MQKQITSKVKSILAMTYWHLEQMVTLSESLTREFGEEVHEMLKFHPSNWDVNCDHTQS